MKLGFRTAIVVGALASNASATDWIVDATGATSPFTNITQAMVQSTPGDRILVKPGSYPPFQFTHGVDVIGLGTDPSQVLVQRVDYHVSVPIIGYDTSLENMTVCHFAPDDGHGISGNELPHGTLAMTSVITCGGVYLRGDGGFYLMMDNCRIEPDAGEGFLNTALTFGGGIADIVDTLIVGAAASTLDGTPSGTAVRIGGGATVRISGSHVIGGAGERASSDVYQHGGHAIDVGFGSAPVNLRLAGDTLVRGGNATSAGSGGAGVRINGTILLGAASVQGGTGAVPGADYALSGPTQLGCDPHLAVRPGRAFAGSDAFLRPGDVMLLRSDDSMASCARDVAFGFRIDPPSASTISPLIAPTYHGAHELRLMVPYAHTSTQGLPPGKRVYYQAFFTDPISGDVMTSNPVAVTIAP